MCTMSAFGERLKNLRKAAGITQQELAERTGVHLQTVSKWERGLFEPDFSMLGELAAILNVPLERLVGGEEGESTYTGNFNAEGTGRALAAARRAKGESQEEVAAASGVSADIVSKWERGVVCPDIGQLCALSSHFCLPASKLYFGIEEEPASYSPVAVRRRRISVAVIAAVLLCVAAAVAMLLVFARRSFTVTVDGAEYTVFSDEWFTCSPAEKEGYEFKYFKDSTGSIVDFPVKITADSQFTAVYSPHEYTIDYWLNGGSFASDPVYVFDMESGAVQLPVSVKEGVQFLGWYLTPDYSGEAVEQVECAACDIRLYARWSSEVYTVRYELCGGSLSQNNPSSVTAREEYVLVEPLRGGYIFLGWYDSPEGGTRYESVGGAGAKNLTLYARWQQTGENFTITYETDGGELAGGNPVSVGAGEVHTLYGAVKAGYDFVGWNTSPDGGGEWVDRLYAIADNTTLYAIYSPKVYTVVYDLNGGAYEGDPNPNNITYGDSVVLQPLVRGGYTFDGWFTAARGGTRIEEINAGNIMQLTTIYARFTANKYTICLDGAGGTFTLCAGTHEYFEYTMCFDETFTLPACTLAGYDFLGWYLKSGECVEVIDAENIGNITLTAKYRTAGLTYDIVYVLNGGILPENAPRTVAWGQRVTLPEPERKGWLFLGWNTKSDGSGEYMELTPDGQQSDLTLYAVWQEIMVSGSVENFSCKVGSESAVITGYTGSFGKNIDLIIPAYIDGKPVVAAEGRFDRYTESHPDAFYLNSLVIPDTVKRLGENCFNYMGITEPVVIPAGVEEIGAYCFYSTNMSLEFEGGALKSIGENAFSGSYIRNIPVLPEGLERLESNAFFDACIVNCGIVLPDTLKYIGGYALAFSGVDSNSKAEIYLPESVEEIEPFAFEVYVGFGRVYTSLTAAEREKFSDGWDSGAEVIYIEEKVDGITIKNGESELYLSGSHFALPKLYKQGYTFIGWRDGAGNFVNLNYIPLNGGTVLEAVFEEQSPADGRSEGSPFVLKEGTEYEVVAFVDEPFWVAPDAAEDGRIKITFEWRAAFGNSRASCCLFGVSGDNYYVEYVSGVSFTYKGGVLRFECAGMPGVFICITVRMDIM